MTDPSPSGLSPSAAAPRTSGFDWGTVRSLLARDLGAIRRSKAVMLPMVFLPSLVFVVLPLLIALMARDRTLNLDEFVNLMPSALADPVLGHPAQEQLVILVLGYLMAPMFIILPLMVSAVVAGDAFAGEKERRTLETLLHLPIGDRELYVAKLMTGFLPALAVSWIGFTVYALIANITAWPVMQRVFVPTATWAVIIIWLSPAVAALGLGIMVRVSLRVQNTQEAQQLGGAVVLPLVVLAVGQTTTVLLAGARAALVVGAVVWVLAITLNLTGAKAYGRNRLATRL